MSCNLNCLAQWLTKFMGWIGVKIAADPMVFFPFWLCFLLACSLPGFHHLEFVTDNERLFVPHAAIGLQEREGLESVFALNYSKNYVKGHETRYLAQIAVIILAKSSKDGLSNHDGLLELGRKVEQEIHHLKVRTKEYGSIQFMDVCAKSRSSLGQKCQKNHILDLDTEVMDAVRNGDLTWKYPNFENPITKERYFLPTNLGNLTLNTEKDALIEATGLRLHFVLDAKEKLEKAELWQNAILDHISKKDWQSVDYQVYAVNSKSLEKELAQNIGNAFDFLPYSVAFVTFFAVANGFKLNSFRFSKPFVACFGIINAFVSIASACGALFWFGCPWQAINLASLFLLLGVGIDDAFVMLGSYHRICLEHPNESKSEIFRITYEEAAISITITSLTNICSFAIGAILPSFDTVSIFCLYTAVGLVYVYLSTLFFFGAVLAYSHSITWHCNSRIISLCQVKDAKPLSHLFFEEIVLPFVSNRLMKTLVLLAWIASIVFSCYHLQFIKEGLEQSRIARKDTTTFNYFHAEDTYFRNLNYRVHVVINEPLDFSQRSVQDNVSDFVKNLSKLDYLDSQYNLTESWLSQYQISQLSFEDFFQVNAKTPLPLNVHKIEDQKMLTRYMVQTTDIKDAMEEAEMVQSLRNLETPFNVTFFHPYFPYFDQFLQVQPNTMKCLASGIVLVLLITLLLIPDRQAGFILMLAIISIMLLISQAMFLLDIYLDVISMMTLIMSVGFSVDFCVHLSHHFYSSENTGTNLYSRMKCSYVTFGPAIVQGGISTLLGVLPLLLVNSYILSTFAYMVIIVVSLGLLHGLILLPMCFTLTIEMLK